MSSVGWRREQAGREVKLSASCRDGERRGETKQDQPVLEHSVGPIVPQRASPRSSLRYGCVKPLRATSSGPARGGCTKWGRDSLGWKRGEFPLSGRLTTRVETITTKVTRCEGKSDERERRERGRERKSDREFEKCSNSPNLLTAISSPLLRLQVAAPQNPPFPSQRFLLRLDFLLWSVPHLQHCVHARWSEKCLILKSTQRLLKASSRFVRDIGLLWLALLSPGKRVSPLACEGDGGRKERFERRTFVQPAARSSLLPLRFGHPQLQNLPWSRSHGSPRSAMRSSKLRRLSLPRLS